MKSVSLIRQLVLIAIGVAMLKSAPPVFSGVLDALKGGKDQPAMQRVAFVGSAVVKEVQGCAERLAGIELWTPLYTGTELEPGDLIRTGQGTILLRMKDSGSFIKVTPYTVLRLVPFEKGWDRGILSGREETEGFVVRGCRGVALVRLDTGEWQRLTVNTVLAEGAVVRIENNAVVDFFNTRDQKSLRLQGQSETTLRASLIRPGDSDRAVAAVIR